MSATFLDSTEICELTGRKLKNLQVAALRSMGIPFFINAIGRPVVTRTAIEGKPVPTASEKDAWVPPGLRKR